GGRGGGGGRGGRRGRRGRGGGTAGGAVGAGRGGDGGPRPAGPGGRAGGGGGRAEVAAVAVLTRAGVIHRSRRSPDRRARALSRFPHVRQGPARLAGRDRRSRAAGVLGAQVARGAAAAL